MRLSAPSRSHGKGIRVFAALALPGAPRAAPSATSARSPARCRRHPPYGATPRPGAASIARSVLTTHARIAINEGATA